MRGPEPSMSRSSTGRRGRSWSLSRWEGELVGELIVALVPVALGIVLSPLAIMALIAVLVSKRAQVNGAAYLLGWVIGVVAMLGIFTWIFTLLEVHEPGEPPLWIDIVRMVVGAFLSTAAVWVYRKGHVPMNAMAVASTPHEVAKAAPQLPGWLQTVATFRPGRSFLLGLGMFVLNPVQASCAIIASLDLVLSIPGPAATALIGTLFAVVCILPMAIPVIAVLFMGDAAQPVLDRLRNWVATHTNAMNAALLLVIGVLQLQKGLSGLV